MGLQKRCLSGQTWSIRRPLTQNLLPPWLSYIDSGLMLPEDVAEPNFVVIHRWALRIGEGKACEMLPKAE